MEWWEAETAVEKDRLDQGRKADAAQGKASFSVCCLMAQFFFQLLVIPWTVAH